MSDSDDISNHQTPKTSFRVHNLFELTCSETPIADNLIQRSISKTSAKLITSRRRSNLFQNENRIIIEDTPSPVLNRKKNLTGKKKHRSSSSKPRTPVLRLPPSVSSHSSGSKKIKKLLTKEANLNEKAIETSPVNSQTTPGRKISSIFKPKSKQDDDDDNENLGSNLSFNSLKKLERRRNNLVVRLSEIFSNIEIEDTDSNKENQNANNNNNNNHFEINPSPIVIQQRSNYSNAFYDNFESTKIASNSTLAHKTTNTHSLTHVTNDNDETSRFEYTILNSNGRLHINSEKQFVVLATQYIPESKPQLVITDDETETDISSSITKQTSHTSSKNKSDKLSDKTNSFNNNNNLIKPNKSKLNINRYSYCSEDLIQIDEVDIPVDNSNNKSDSDYDDDDNYSFKKSKRPGQKNTSKNRTKFGSTQSPVVISNKSGFVSKITCTNESNETRTTSNSSNTTTTTTRSIEIPQEQEQIISNQPDTTMNKKAKKPLLNVDKLLNDDNVLPGNSNDKTDMPKKKYSNIFKPKKSITNLPPTLPPPPPPAAVTTATTSNRLIDIQNLNSLLVSSMSSCSIEDENFSQERNNNSIVLNLNQEDLEFILDSQGNEQQRVVSRTSSKFSSTRNGSIVEKTTTTTTTKVTKSTAAPAATTSKEVVRAQPKPLVKKQARTNKNNQILLSHFDLNSLVDSLNSTFTLTTENKYNVVFKIGEEIADHVCQLNDKQFFDKTKILCLIKELISNDVNFIPSVLNPRLKFTTIQNNESSTNTSTDSSNSSSSSGDDSNDLNECNTCLQRNKLLTEVCISCRLYYHKKCEKIKYIPKNGWICSKCKTKKT